MKIKLLIDLPVEQKHNLLKGMVLDVFKDNYKGVWVVSDTKEKVLVLNHEYEVIKEN